MSTTIMQSSVLPTVKCSMCAQNIEISQMGDHVCGVSGAPTPPLDSLGKFDKITNKQKPINSRMMPPRVDTSAANRPFFPQGHLTPVSASPSRTGSPMSSYGGHRSPFARPSRSATAPIPRAPPSPDLLSSNLDCAFPPFPTKQAKPTQSKLQKPSGYGGLGLHAEPESMYAPISPRTATSGGLLQRMNTIAPGPFDINRGGKTEEKTKPKEHQRQVTASSLKGVSISLEEPDTATPIARPSTANPGHTRTSTNGSNGSNNSSQPGTAVPQLPKTSGYGGFGPPNGEDSSYKGPLRAENRSQTFPLLHPVQISEPRSSSVPRRPSNESSSRSKAGNGRKPSTSGPDLTRPLPPRGASLIRPRANAPPGEIPPIPDNVNLAAEFGVGNPYHTPTESQSSNTSGFSEDSKASSRSSPLSAAPNHSRKPSDKSQMNILMSEIESSMTELQPKTFALSSNSSPVKEKVGYAPYRPGAVSPSLQSFILPQSPTDPAVQNGRLSPSIPDPAMQPPRSKSGPENGSDGSVRRLPSSKGNCKGCGNVIKGKSVSSADGRLTGRYHKHCFVCRTCSEPFQTATFYVISDAPYCERHYHKLNGSICTTCDKGIEGQYLETQRGQKFHHGCLKCADCNRSLKHDYFEMNDRVYCERDAFRRAQQGRALGGGLGANLANRMERRTTKLMMMGDARV